ncbi:MAG: 16S rRNA (cytosine(967)-C(5))-methyltransferase RsmB [Eubacterium sp.]|nr:16S rRNA (cytosine(967)-C(5))-methyltransferase RsmB [Eubacterium sp.]MBR0413319.1 16S rRNA (cytosine(967)-C(5))-methyltransferase RsmB [Eubacterium sp.]
MKNARLIAFEVLDSVFKDGAYSNIAVDKALDGVDSKNKAFVSSLVYGVCERKITLDYLLEQHLTTKPKRKVMLLLYIGAYQLYFMDKVPDSAAINTAVELAGEVGLGYYKKLINAVLRKVDGNRVDINKIEDLSVRFSCPEHLINMWNKMYGAENTLSILSAINGKPPVFAVPNTLYVTADELLYELQNCGINGEVIGGVVRITSAFDLSNCKPFVDGLFHIEDLSSFTCATALDVQQGDTVIDFCSAPGGKTFTLAEFMNNTGTVYAYDLYPHRVKLIDDGAKRLGLTKVVAAVNDACEHSENVPLADRILCDVPCSGFGIIRRKPEIRYKDLDSIKELPEIQYRILTTSAEYLKQGGRIVYSTCTLNKRENEKVVQRFIDEQSGYKLLYDKTIFPTADGGDGFYYAVIEKTDD